MSAGLDRRHVGAGRFDAQHLDLFAEEIAHARLHRRIAAAMQHELGITPKQAGRIDAERQVAVDARLRAVRDGGLGVTRRPSRFSSSCALAAHDYALAAGKAAGPPAGAARLIACRVAVAFGGRRLRRRRCGRCGHRSRRIFAARDRRALAHRRTAARGLVFGRLASAVQRAPVRRAIGSRRLLARRRRRRVEVGDGVVELGLGRGRARSALRPKQNPVPTPAW